MKYLQIKGLSSKNDDVLRITAKIHRVNAEYQKAVRTLLGVKELNQGDLVFLTDLLESVRNDHKTMEFFKRALNRTGAPPWVYIRLADILYEMGERTDALRYYSTAASFQQKGPGIKPQDLEWALYRISVLSPGADAKNTLENIHRKNDTDTFHRFSGLLLKELNVSERMNGIF
jgi:DNA-binding SARP family transcriptional activator